MRALYSWFRRRRPGRFRTKGLLELSDEVTELLKKVVIVLLIAVVVSQLALQIPQVRVWVTGVDRLEGTPF